MKYTARVELAAWHALAGEPLPNNIPRRVARLIANTSPAALVMFACDCNHFVARRYARMVTAWRRAQAARNT